MKVTGIVGVILIVLFIVTSILVGNWFFSTFLGIDVEKIPAPLKFLVHLAGVGAVLFVLKKFFAR